MEALKKVFSPGHKVDDELMYGSGNIGSMIGNPGKISGDESNSASSHTEGFDSKLSATAPSGHTEPTQDRASIASIKSGVVGDGLDGSKPTLEKINANSGIGSSKEPILHTSDVRSTDVVAEPDPQADRNLITPGTQETVAEDQAITSSSYPVAEGSAEGKSISKLIGRESSDPTSYQQPELTHQSTENVVQRPETTIQQEEGTYRQPEATTQGSSTSAAYQQREAHYEQVEPRHQILGSTYQPPKSTSEQPSSSTYRQSERTYIPTDTSYQPPGSTYESKSTFQQEAAHQPTETAYEPSQLTSRQETAYQPAETGYQPSASPYKQPLDSIYQPPGMAYHQSDSAYQQSPESDYRAPPDSTYRKLPETTYQAPVTTYQHSGITYQPPSESVIRQSPKSSHPQPSESLSAPGTTYGQAETTSTDKGAIFGLAHAKQDDIRDQGNAKKNHINATEGGLSGEDAMGAGKTSHHGSGEGKSRQCPKIDSNNPYLATSLDPRVDSLSNRSRTGRTPVIGTSLSSSKNHGNTSAEYGTLSEDNTSSGAQTLAKPFDGPKGTSESLPGARETSHRSHGVEETSEPLEGRDEHHSKTKALLGAIGLGGHKAKNNAHDRPQHPITETGHEHVNMPIRPKVAGETDKTSHDAPVEGGERHYGREAAVGGAAAAGAGSIGAYEYSQHQADQEAEERLEAEKAHQRALDEYRREAAAEQKAHDKVLAKEEKKAEKEHEKAVKKEEKKAEKEHEKAVKKEEKKVEKEHEKAIKKEEKKAEKEHEKLVQKEEKEHEKAIKREEEEEREHEIAMAKQQEREAEMGRDSDDKHKKKGGLLGLFKRRRDSRGNEMEDEEDDQHDGSRTHHHHDKHHMNKLHKDPPPGLYHGDAATPAYADYAVKENDHAGARTVAGGYTAPDPKHDMNKLHKDPPIAARHQDDLATSAYSDHPVRENDETSTRPVSGAHTTTSPENDTDRYTGDGVDAAYGDVSTSGYVR